MKEFLVANTDLSTQFEKISDRAKTATNNLRAASQRGRNRRRRSIYRLDSLTKNDYGLRAATGN